MKKKNNNSTEATTLRHKAEELLKKRPTIPASRLSEAEALKLIQELEVHQIELEMQNEELMLAKSIDEKSAEIAIKDTGIGMTQEMVVNLFRPDVKTSRAGTEGELSTGLGLMLSKEFIEKHGGKIWVESEEGKGSTFYFTLASGLSNT